MVEKFMGYMDDDENGIKQAVYYEEQKDRLIIADEQDITPILDENRRARNNAHGKRFGDWCHVAKIPAIVINMLMKNGIWYDKKKFKKWLNKSEYKNLRTKEGQI